MNVTLNGTSIDFKYGFPITEKLNEDLDTGSIIFPKVEELSIAPLDEVLITDTGYTKYMLVSDIQRQINSFDSPKTYNYFVSLISPTIQLQRIVLPNRSVTQPLTGTKTSIYTVLSQYVSLYTDFTISTALQTLTTDIDCPEFQWNRPTLFEVINDLLSEVDCVVTMSTFTEISYLDLNPTGSTITDDGLNNELLTQSLQEYANKIECEVENAIVPKRNTRVIEWIAVKTDDDVLLTTDNAKIILEHSIDKINSITCRRVTGDTIFTGNTADITSRVVEKTQYDLALPSNSVGNVTGNYKRDRLYYERGNNKIEGLTYTDDSWAGITTIKAVLNVLNNAYYDENGSYITIPALANSQIVDIYMQVDYQTQDTVKFVSNKDTTYLGLTTGDKLTMVNNQDTSYVDFVSFANKQQQTVDRIGNPQLELHGKYTLTTMPDLGDVRSLFYKLYHREYVVNKDEVVFKGFASENYVLKNLFTGLKQQRRFTSIALGNEALESNHVEEIAFNLTKQGNVLSLVSELVADSTFENYMLRFGQADENIKMVQFNTDESGDIGVPPSVYYTGRSIILTFKMADNFSAGLQLDDTTDLLHNYVPYVDDDGNFTYYSYKLYKAYDFINEYPQVTYPAHKIRALPEVDTNLLLSTDLVYESGNIYRYKDNREITVETKQFNFVSGSNVFYGKLFFTENPMTYTGDSDKSYFVAYSYSSTYDGTEQEALGTVAPITSLYYSISNNQITISSPDSSIVVDDLTSWAICDVSRNIVISANN